MWTISLETFSRLLPPSQRKGGGDNRVKTEGTASTKDDHAKLPILDHFCHTKKTAISYGSTSWDSDCGALKRGRGSTGAERVKNDPVCTGRMAGRLEMTLTRGEGESALPRVVKCVFYVLFLFGQKHRSLSVPLGSEPAAQSSQSRRMPLGFHTWGHKP